MMKTAGYKLAVIYSLIIGLIFSPQVTLAVSTIGTNISTAGNLTANGTIKFTSGAGNNYILASDAAGTASWLSVSTVLSNASLGVGAASGIAPLDAFSQVPLTNLPVGVPGGIATLDGSGLVPTAQLPAIAITNTYVTTSTADLTSLTLAHKGDVAVVTSGSQSFILSQDPPTTFANWQELLSPTNNALLKASNLSDLTDNAAARINIGLGSVTNNAQIAKSIGTAKGDIIAYTASDIPFNLPVGSNGQVLTANSSASAGVEWANSSSGFADPMTTAGDIIIRDFSNTTTRLPVGASGQILTVSASGTPSWIAPSGSGITSLNGLVASSQNFTNDTNVTISSSGSTHTFGWTGQLAISRGGTNGSATPTSGAVAYGTGSAYGFTPAGSAGECLISSGAGAPAWGTCASGTTGITSLNGLTTVAQNFVNDTNITISSSGSTHTLTWAGILSPARGGTGVNNGTATLTLGGNLTTSGFSNLTFVTTGNTSITLPTSGTLFTNPMSVLGDIIYGGASGTATALSIGTSGQVLTVSASGTPYWSTISSGGITLLNGLSTSTQYFTTGTSGTDFTIVSSGATHTFNFPNASAANRGLLTSTDWTTFNNKLSTSTAASTYSPIAGSANITTLGTIGTGTWNATAIAPAYGGTGLASLTQYAIPYAASSTAFTELPIGTANQVLSVNGTANGYTWITLGTGTGGITSLNGLTAVSQNFVNDTNITISSSGSTHTLTWAGILSPARGGTGVNNGTATLTLGGNLTTSGSSNLTFVTTGNTSITLPTSGTLFSDPMTTAGDIVIRNFSNATDRLPIGTSGQVLTVSASGTPSWVAPSGSGIASLNGLIASTQYFTTGTSGTDFTIVSSGATHTFNFPNASAANRGLLTSTDWTTFNNKLSTSTAASTYEPTIATGTAGQYWRGDKTWQTLNATAVGLSNVTNNLQVYASAFTTAGDLLVGSGSSSYYTLGIGTANQVLAVSTGGAVVWQTPASGFADPMTNRGDIIVRNSSNTTARLGLGATGTVLYSNGSDIIWQQLAKSDVGLSNVENTALSTWPGTANITTLGTIGTGTWNATTIGVTKGGTGLTSILAGQLIYGSATDTYSALSAGSTGQVLTISGGLPVWSTPSSSGIASLNGLTASTQTFSVGTTGTDFTISSTGTVHTFNIPNASAANRGLLTSTDWTLFNNKLSTTTADLTYLTISAASGTYLTSASASALYYSVSNPSNYITSASGSALYYSISNPSNYLNTGTASLLYQPIGSYLTQASASALYLGISATATDSALLQGHPASYFQIAGTYLTTAVTTLNGLNTASQNFAIGTSGTDFTIVSSGATHTFNFPNASAANRGLLTSTDWTTFYNKLSTTTAAATYGAGTGTNNYNTYWTGLNTLGAEQYVAISRGGTGQNWSGVATGSLAYFSGVGAMGTLSAATSGYVLTANGANIAPSWKISSGMPVGTTNYSTLRYDTGTSSWTENTTFLANAGALSGISSLDLITVSSSTLTFPATGTISSTGANALTIDSGTTGTLNIGTGVNSKTINIGNSTGTTGLNFYSGTGNIIFTIDGTGTSGLVQIGNSLSSTPDLLKLDVGIADPTGSTGGMYYSSALNQFRGYQNGAWKNFVMAATSTKSFILSAGQSVVDSISGTNANADAWKLYDATIKEQFSRVYGNTATQSLDVTYQTFVPSDFSSWASNAIAISFRTSSATAASSSASCIVRDTNGVAANNATTATASTGLSSINITSANIATGTFTPGSAFMITCNGAVNNATWVDIGKIILNYSY